MKRTFSNPRVAIISIICGLLSFPLMYVVDQTMIGFLLLLPLVGMVLATFSIKTKLGAVAIIVNGLTFLSIYSQIITVHTK